MDYTIIALKDKIMEFHPEIAAKGINLTVGFDEAGNRFSLKLGKDGAEVGAFLDRKDADACMDGQKCVNLAVQVAQTLAELEDLLNPRKPG
jgi:hypothetical protein